MAIATAAKQIAIDGMAIVVAGGQENISAVQNNYFGWVQAERDENVLRCTEHAYMAMLQTAEVVVGNYKISREAQNLYALSSQQKTAAAQAAGRFDAEIVPITATMAVVDKTTKAVSHRAGKGRGQSARYDACRPCHAAGGAGRRHGHGRHCQPALGCSLGLRRHGSQARAG
jgi:hypothetical protein